jgi:hypothetical protein
MEVSRPQPLATADAPEKFLNCARRVVTEETAYSVIEMVETLEQRTELGPLFEFIQGSLPTNPT